MLGYMNNVPNNVFNIELHISSTLNLLLYQFLSFATYFQGKGIDPAKKLFPPSEVKKWAIDDLNKTIQWLESQEEKVTKLSVLCICYLLQLMHACSLPLFER